MSTQRDLFDQPGAKGPGERQTDLEDIAFEKSLAGLIMAGDRKGADELCNQARQGQTIRIM